MEHIEHKRKKLLEAAFEHYSFECYKLWAIDKTGELIQQMARLRTPRCDKEELVRTALMVEDAIGMLWMLLRHDSRMIEEAKEEIYEEFEHMLKEAGCEVAADKGHEMPVQAKSTTPMSAARV